MYEAFLANGSSCINTAAELGLSEAGVRRRVTKFQLHRWTAEDKQGSLDLGIEEIPDEDIPIEDLLANRIKAFNQKKAYENATSAIQVKIGIPGPIGLLFFGDPHVDDNGTDIGMLKKHAELTHIDGVWGCNVGDTTNNWIGRLARLYAEQSTSASQAWRLAEWFIHAVKWAFMVGGNHDGWSGAGDPIKWIARQANALYQPSAARIQLNFLNKTSVIVNARHDFPGHSQYNPAHGAMKALQFGVRDHINVAGHRHVSGYGVIKDPDSKRICHAVQVASYKIYDRYALEKGFRDQNISPCAFTIIDPSLPDTHPDKIKLFWDPELGVDVLKWLRKRAAK